VPTKIESAPGSRHVFRKKTSGGRAYLQIAQRPAGRRDADFAVLCEGRTSSSKSMGMAACLRLPILCFFWPVCRLTAARPMRGSSHFQAAANLSRSGAKYHSFRDLPQHRDGARFDAAMAQPPWIQPSRNS
jgi:hypothetical protein